MINFHSNHLVFLNLFIHVRPERPLNEPNIIFFQSDPSSSNEREMFNSVITLVPVAALNRAEVLPLEPSWIRATTSDVDDFVRVDTDDCERIVDRVGTGVPPTKEVAIIWAAVESLGADRMTKISRDEASRLRDRRSESLIFVDLHCSAEELLHFVGVGRRGTRLYVTKHFEW